jgi:hypothetical protein
MRAKRAGRWWVESERSMCSLLSLSEGGLAAAADEFESVTEAASYSITSLRTIAAAPTATRSGSAAGSEGMMLGRADRQETRARTMEWHQCTARGETDASAEFLSVVQLSKRERDEDP